MAEITLDEEALGYMRLFQSLSTASVRDCIEQEGRVVFVVGEGDAGRAVGKGGEHVVKFSKMTGKDVLVIEFSPDPVTFVRNVFQKYDVRDVAVEEREGVTHATVTVDPTKKGRAIGRDARNLKMARRLISRHHPIQSVSVA